MMSPFVIVIFGATGDLAQRKLFPALFSLYQQGKLGDNFFIVGFARRMLTDLQYSQMIENELEYHGDKQWAKFAKNIYYQQGLFDERAGYEALINKLNTFDKKIGACITRLFYLATPPDNYESILHHLSITKLSEGCGQGSEKWTKLAIEKPFGKDLETARDLDLKLAQIFEERQIFRVDHYLGKETVQNMLAFRFANSIFDPVWNNKYIDHVQITYAEKRGVSKRGKFFDGVGMLRDVGQNHLLQLLATVAMEQPTSFAKESIRDVRANAIKAIRPLASSLVATSVVRGQYVGYQAETNVAPDSQTETFIAMKLLVDTERFAGVPFYLRAGKQLRDDRVEIKVVFKQTCQLFFKEAGCPEIGNVLTIHIQPDEGLTLTTIVKKPGTKLLLDTAPMKFSYDQTFGSHGVEAYEKILLDIMSGDQMLFNRSDELASSWQLISTILKSWEKEKKQRVTFYQEGSWGPKAANELIERDGRKWL